MNVIHITQTKNIENIMKHGIMRSKPLLDQYDDVMEKEYGNLYNKERGLVFCIQEGVKQRDKYIKDFFYWKTWGDNRNKFIDKNIDNFDDLCEKGPKIFSHIKPKSLYFSILLLDIPNEPIFEKYCHVQNHIMSPLWTDMELKYEHDDKPLALVNYDIKSNNIIKIIGTGQSIITKNNKIDTSLHI